jgi:DNA-binding MarR family transcriptional regulator
MNNLPNSKPLAEALDAWSGIFTRRSIHDFLSFMHHSNLSMPHLNILMQLYYHGPQSLLALRQTMLTSRAAATQLVDKLVQLKLVERTEDTRDRRVKMIHLTDAGRKLVSDTLAARDCWMKQLTDQIPENEQLSIAAALNLLVDAATHLQTVSNHQPDMADSQD